MALMHRRFSRACCSWQGWAVHRLWELYGCMRIDVMLVAYRVLAAACDDTTLLVRGARPAERCARKV
jgi:hypothetical protein